MCIWTCVLPQHFAQYPASKATPLTMPRKPHVLRYFVELAPHSVRSTGDVCTVVWNQTNFYDHAGGEPTGDSEVLIILGLWWDGSRPKFALYPNEHCYMSPEAILADLRSFYYPNQILIAYAMDEYKDVGGSTVWVQRLSTWDRRWYDVWYSPLKDKWHCLATLPNSWAFWGTMDNNMNKLTPLARAKPNPKAKARARANKNKTKAKVRVDTKSLTTE